MRIAYTGNGFLGKQLNSQLNLVHLECDITNQASVHEAVSAASPDVVIHTAAMTNVDECEKDAKKAFDVNVRGTSNLLATLGADQILIYLSTDHVFSGEHWFGEGYKEVHRPSPVNNYGFTKWGGEVMLSSAVCRTLVIRSSKMFSAETLNPDIKVLHSGWHCEFTSLIKRSFLHVNHFITGLDWVIQNFDLVKKQTDILHLSGKGVYSFYDFWIMASRILDFDPNLVVPRKVKLKDATPRPFRGGLDVSLAKRLGVPLFDASDGLRLIKEKGV